MTSGRVRTLRQAVLGIGLLGIALCVCSQTTTEDCCLALCGTSCGSCLDGDAVDACTEGGPAVAVAPPACTSWNASVSANGLADAQFGSDCDADTGVAAIDGMAEGRDVVARADARQGLVRLDSTARRVVLECEIEIEGGPLEQPVTCSVGATMEAPWDAEPLSAPLVFRATLVETGGPGLPVNAQATANCGAGGVAVPVATAPVPGQPSAVAVPIGGASGTCEVTASLTGGAGTVGDTSQLLTVYWRSLDAVECRSNADCRDLETGLDFCGDDGTCQAGTAGQPCSHDTQCDADAGLFCGPDFTCRTGAVGQTCDGDADCAAGATCDGGACTEAG